MEKSYDKYYVKKNPSTNEILSDGNEPMLGECAKRDCRLEPRHVKILNKGWINSGVYFLEVKPEVVETDDSSDNTRLALETEARELGVSFRANIGDDKLQEKINEAKAIK